MSTGVQQEACNLIRKLKGLVKFINSGGKWVKNSRRVFITVISKILRGKRSKITYNYNEYFDRFQNNKPMFKIILKRYKLKKANERNE